MMVAVWEVLVLFEMFVLCLVLALYVGIVSGIFIIYYGKVRLT